MATPTTDMSLPRAWPLLFPATFPRTSPRSSIVATLGNVWFVMPFAAATFVNGCLHLVLTIATRRYSPGVITGSLFWIQLGAYTLRHNQNCRARRSGAPCFSRAGAPVVGLLRALLLASGELGSSAFVFAES